MTVVRGITTTMLGHYPGPFPTGKSGSRMQSACVGRSLRFGTEAETKKAKDLWNKVSAERFKDMICKARNAAKKKCGGNIKDAKDFAPPWIRKDYWEELIKEWSKDEWIKISNLGSTNRNSGGGGLRHVGGSKSFLSHGKRMADEMGKDISQREVFNKTHKRYGEYINEKSKRVGETYESTLNQKYGEEVFSQPLFDADAWVAATGGPNRGRLYGFGSRQKPSIILGTSSSSADATPFPPPPANEAQWKAFVETPTFKCLMAQQLRGMLEELGLPSQRPQPNDSSDHVDDQDDDVDGSEAGL